MDDGWWSSSSRDRSPLNTSSGRLRSSDPQLHIVLLSKPGLELYAIADAAETWYAVRLGGLDSERAEKRRDFADRIVLELPLLVEEVTGIV